MRELSPIGLCIQRWLFKGVALGTKPITPKPLSLGLLQDTASRTLSGSKFYDLSINTRRLNKFLKLK